MRGLIGFEMKNGCGMILPIDDLILYALKQNVDHYIPLLYLVNDSI